MFQGLRRRILVAFTLLIILSACLSGWLAWRATAREFDLFVIEEGRAEAELVADYVEAAVNHAGSFDQIEDWLVSPHLPEDIFFQQILPTISQESIEVEVEVHVEGALFEELTSERISQEHVLSENIVSRILGPVVVEEIDSSSATPFMIFGDEATGQIEALPLVELVAAELDIPVAELARVMKELPINELAEEQGLTPEELTNAILLRQSTAMQIDSKVHPNEAVFILNDIRLLLNDLLFIDIEERVLKGDPSFLEQSILGDGRVFITDAAGEIRFDSEDNEREGDLLDVTFLENGVPFREWKSGDVIGYVVVAAGEGFYQFREENFLSNLVRSLIIGGLIVTIVALVAGTLLAQRITAPITELTTAVTRLAKGESTERLEVRSQDELGQMSGAFNYLANSLDTQRELRGQLISDVSHELNTPLSIIRLEMEALRDGIQDGAEAAQRVLSEVNLLGNLASDLSILAETDRGGIQLSMTDLDMTHQLDQAVARWQAEAEAARIALRNEPVTKQIDTIQADANRIGQVLGNLIRNAIQHTPIGGEIIVSTGYGTVPQTSGQWLITSVCDTGSGIPEDAHSRIFERFYRVDSARQRHTGGRGLGLAIVQDIIELHGGHVWVESTEGEGSSFYFALRP